MSRGGGHRLGSEGGVFGFGLWWRHSIPFGGRDGGGRSNVRKWHEQEKRNESDLCIQGAVCTRKEARLFEVLSVPVPKLQREEQIGEVCAELLYAFPHRLLFYANTLFPFCIFFICMSCCFFFFLEQCCNYRRLELGCPWKIHCREAQKIASCFRKCTLTLFRESLLLQSCYYWFIASLLKVQGLTAWKLWLGIWHRVILEALVCISKGSAEEIKHLHI